MAAARSHGTLRWWSEKENVTAGESKQRRVWQLLDLKAHVHRRFPRAERFRSVWMFSCVVAADAAQDIVRRLAGVDVSAGDANAAVRKVMAHG